MPIFKSLNTLKLLTASLLTASLMACVTTPNNPTTDNDTLTDAQLVAIAKQDDRQPALDASGVIVGVHNGINVLEEFHCSDLCPENTMRVVHYDIEDKAQCQSVGGVTKSILTPIAITIMPKDYCFPAVIADYWESYPYYKYYE